MPDSRKKEFIHETITKPENRKKRLLQKLFLNMGMALIFGVVASLTFVVFKPLWEDQFSETTPPESISIPRDETTSAPPETSSAETSTQAAEDPSELESMVQSLIEANQADVQDYQNIFHAMGNVVVTANKSLAVITANKTGIDLFDNEVQSNAETCGMIVAIISSEVVILTDDSLLGETDSFYVTFGNYGGAEGYLKQVDSVTGLAVITVPVSSLDTSVTDHIQPIPLGNSYVATQGNPVIAMGTPLGYTKSVSYGMISYINGNVQGEDCILRLMQTNITGVDNARGMLLNLDGELIGWITPKYPGSSGNLLAAISISDLKPMIQKLSNGEKITSLGIMGQTITAEIAEAQDLPMGVYISQCISGKSAYAAGLQSGDILTAIGDVPILSMKDVQTCMENLPTEDRMTVNVQRGGREGYTEKVFEVVLKPR